MGTMANGDAGKVVGQPTPRTWYFYDADASAYSMGRGHPSQAHRAMLTHSLLTQYEMLSRLSVCKDYVRPGFMDLTKFHTDDYVRYLASLSPTPPADNGLLSRYFNVEEDGDNPPFDGVYEFSQMYTGGTLAGAARLGKGEADVAINWLGGFQHAMKSSASGTGYINDVVLGILELLKYFERVLYVNLDSLHCDAVEEAFYTTDRVMTLSFHQQFTDHFPGTGDIRDIGYGKGQNYAVNCPLLTGLSDDALVAVFEPIMEEVMSHFKPTAIVFRMASGALAGDRFGSFNLTLDGYMACLRTLQSTKVPMLLLGGGMSSSANAARLWTVATAQLLGVTLPTAIPYHDYFEYYGPHFALPVHPVLQDDCNTRSYLSICCRTVMDNIAKTKASAHKLPSIVVDEPRAAPSPIDTPPIKVEADKEPAGDDVDMDAGEAEPTEATAEKEPVAVAAS